MERQHLLESERDRLLEEQNRLYNQLRFIERRLDNVIGELALEACTQPEPAERPALYVIKGGKP